MSIEKIVLYNALGMIKGVGRKALEGLTAEVLEQVCDENDFLQLFDFVRSKATRIRPHMADELKPLLYSAYRTHAESIERGIVGLTRFDEGYPKLLKNIDAPPVALYFKGNLGCLNENCIAVVGTRKPSPFAEKLGVRLGNFVAERGFNVVSGLAEGCDTAGHKGCIQAGRPTIAIMGTSLDEVYPNSNIRLSEEIVECGGCLVSEYPIGTKMNRYNFVERDRLQAGMSIGVLVVEMGLRGGTLHAVNAAIKDNKPVGCIAYDPRHYDAYENSRGNRDFIADGRAVAITDGMSIESYLNRCVNLPAETMSLF